MATTMRRGEEPLDGWSAMEAYAEERGATLVAFALDDDGDGCFGVAIHEGHRGAILITGTGFTHWEFNHALFYRDELARRLVTVSRLMREYERVGLLHTKN
jgi:hypothetical protein